MAMANRRITNRPASSEELDCWSHARTSLKSLSNLYDDAMAADPVGRVNRLISMWPADDASPAEGIDALKPVYKKLTSALNEIRTNAEAEARATDEAIERLGVLIALRKASEATPLEKRPKRPRLHSPPPAPVPMVPPPSRSVSITLPPRSSAGPSPPIPFSRDPKARREALAKQLPLQEGRKVAFHPPPHSGKPGEPVVAEPTDENAWILAVITKCINQDKNRYEVQDVEPQEDGAPGQRYNTTLRAIIPLPDPGVSPDHPAHLNAYPEYSTGSTVMALYPDTSCFYKAEVIATLKEMQRAGVLGKNVPTYKLKFEDDDDQEHHVAAQWVVEWPGQ